jgi:LysM repeat protein
MHPDKKVGMALGILLVGIVGAFFFRNDTEATEKEDSWKLASAEELDDRIRRGDQVPYLPDREAGPSHMGEVPDINIADLIAEIPDVDSTNSVVIPQPIRIGEPGRSHDLVAPIPSPSSDLKGVDEAVARSGDSPGIFAPAKSSVSGGTRKTTTPTVRIHEVASGETLSSLSLKYLGTHRRYRELFEANRDLLKSPDALQVGMKLRIPQKQGVQSASAVPTAPGTGAELRTAPEPKSVTPTEATLPKPKFVRPTSKVPRISSNPNRSLGQRPPPGVPRVEGLDTVVARRRTPEKAALREKSSDKPAGTRR